MITYRFIYFGGKEALRRSQKKAQSKKQPNNAANQKSSRQSNDKHHDDDEKYLIHFNVISNIGFNNRFDGLCKCNNSTSYSHQWK